jgi:hypothetical protein
MATMNKREREREGKKERKQERKTGLVLLYIVPFRIEICMYWYL